MGKATACGGEDLAGAGERMPVAGPLPAMGKPLPVERKLAGACRRAAGLLSDGGHAGDLSLFSEREGAAAAVRWPYSQKSLVRPMRDCVLVLL